jgi:GTP-binding protein
MDGYLAFQKQDLAIAKIALHEGKALIFAFNKIDRIVETQGMQEIDNYDYDTFESVFKIPIVYISGQSGKNVKKLLDTVLTSYNAWKIQIKTPELNKWLKIAYNKFHPPLLKERKTALKIKYIVQTATQPPTFNLFANSIDIQTSYLRYLKRSLADYFKLYGIIIRFNIKKTNNPYGKNP